MFNPEGFPLEESPKEKKDFFPNNREKDKKEVASDNKNIKEGEISPEAMEMIEKKESIEKIEKTLLSPGNKIDLMLIIFNEKRAAFLGNFDGAESEEHKEKLIKEFSEELNNITNLLNDLNLPYEISRNIKDDNEVIGFSLMVAKEKEDLNKIIEANKNKA
ncbi:MAG: hypothetical protein NTZ84_03500 [Candidatus Nealsonbacteria bacterium]|nr:hypothetical protein [Candidatus Nealsonbacteria bacterium]